MFLAADTFVIPTLKQDYPEWHLGRTLFSLWYLEIDCPELLAYCEQLKTQFSQLLFSPNTRQLHITLFVCGFWQNNKKYADDFNHIDLIQQKERLVQLKLNPFSLTIQGLNSFESALFLQVQDIGQNLTKIRDALACQQQEIAALTYCPHITLGLYHKKIPSNHILNVIANMPTPSFEVQVKSLSFGGYQANVLQGPLHIIETYPLGVTDA